MELLSLSPSTASFLDYEDINPSIHVRVTHQSIPDLDRDDSIYSDWPEVLAILSNFINISYESFQVYPNDDIIPPPHPYFPTGSIKLPWGGGLKQRKRMCRFEGISLKKMMCIVTLRVGVMTVMLPMFFQLTCPQGIAFMKCISSTLELSPKITKVNTNTPNEGSTPGTWRYYLFFVKGERSTQSINLLGFQCEFFGGCNVCVNCRHLEIVDGCLAVIQIMTGWHLFVEIKVVCFSQLLIYFHFVATRPSVKSVLEYAFCR